jgi:integrase
MIPLIPFLDLYAASEPPTPGALPWSEFTELVMELYLPSARSRDTARAMRYALKAMVPLGVTDTSHLTVGLIAKYVDAQPPTLSPNSIRARLRSIRVFCRMAQKLGHLQIDPFEVRPLGAWVRPRPAMGKKHHSRADIKLVLDEMREQAAADGWPGWRAKRLYFLTALFAYTGLRASEAYHLYTIDLNLDDELLYVVARPHNKLKTYASAACIPLAPMLIPLARDWLKARMSVPPGFPHDPDCPWLFPTVDRRHPWTSGAPGAKPRDRIASVGHKCGVEGFNPLSLRHSLATHLVGAGAGRSEVQRMLRHSNPETQLTYIHYDLENMRRLVARIQF